MWETQRTSRTVAITVDAGRRLSWPRIHSPGTPGSKTKKAPSPKTGRRFYLYWGQLRGQRNAGDGFEDARSDLVRIALRVGTTIFQVTLVVVFHEGVRDPDGSAAISQAIGEL